MKKIYSIYILGTDESRKEISNGAGFNKIQLINGYIYGIKDNILYKINEETEDINKIADNVTDYIATGNDIYMYKTDKDKLKTGIYNIENEDKLLINGTVSQMLIDNQNIYVVTNASTEKSLVKYSLGGTKKAILTEKTIVSNIIQDNEYIYYSNKSDNNKIYKINKAGGASTKISNNSCIQDNDYFNGNRVMAVYNDKIIYINSKDNKIYVTGTGNNEDAIIVDNEVTQLQLKGHMLYFSLKDKIAIYRYNLDKNELQEITSARICEMICIN